MTVTGERADAARLVGASAITFVVDGEPIGYSSDGATVTAVVDPDAATVVGLSRAVWDDLVAQQRTAINLFLAGELDLHRGGFDGVATWEPVLRLLHAGVPIYHPDRADLGGLDPRAAVTLEAADDELADRLRRVGYLHVRGVFDADELAAANAEVDRLAAEARPGDDRSWWAATPDGAEVLCRLVYATLRSPLLADLVEDPRVQRLGRLLDPTMRFAADRMENGSILLKAPGRTLGLSNIPWHQDCGMGGHALLCPIVAVGIQLTGSSAATGHLEVVPGSAGQSLPHDWARTLPDTPVVAIDTDPGDVTVHIADVLHASPAPTGDGGRRTMYATFYRPVLWDHVGPGEAYNDLVRNRGAEVAALRRSTP